MVPRALPAPRHPERGALPDASLRPAERSTCATGMVHRIGGVERCGGDRLVAALVPGHAQGMVGRVEQGVDVAGTSGEFGHADRNGQDGIFRQESWRRLTVRQILRARFQAWGIKREAGPRQSVVVEPGHDVAVADHRGNVRPHVPDRTIGPVPAQKLVNSAQAVDRHAQ